MGCNWFDLFYLVPQYGTGAFSANASADEESETAKIQFRVSPFMMCNGADGIARLND